MADQKFNPVTRKFYSPGAGGPATQRGAEAGQDAKYDAQARKDQKAKFDAEKGWAGIANVAKRPKGPEYEKQFTAWLMKRGKNEGQRKALKDTE